MEQILRLRHLVRHPLENTYKTFHLTPETLASASIGAVMSVRDMKFVHAGSKNLESASIDAVMSKLSKITSEPIMTWRKERAQLDTGLKTIREPSNVTPINPACSFKSLAKLSSMDLHVDDMYAKRQADRCAKATRVILATACPEN